MTRRLPILLLAAAVLPAPGCDSNPNGPTAPDRPASPPSNPKAPEASHIAPARPFD